MKSKMNVVRTAAALVVLCVGTNAFAQDFNALIARGGQQCSTVRATRSPPTCSDWIRAGSCITARANSAPEACSDAAAAAAEALTGAQAACGAQAQEVTNLRAQLANCPTNNPVTARTAPRFQMPICLSAPEAGGGWTWIRLRNGHVCQVRMSGRSTVNEIVDGGSECASISVDDVATAHCQCPPGTGAVLAQGGRHTYMCAGIFRPAAETDPTLASRVSSMEGSLALLTERVDNACRHTPVGPSESPTVTREGGETPVAPATLGAHVPTNEIHEPRVGALSCFEFNAIVLGALLRAAGTGSSTSLDTLNNRLTTLETTVGEHGTQLNDHEDRLQVLERNQRNTWQWRAMVGFEAGYMNFSQNGMAPVYSTFGVQMRYNITSVFSLHAEGGGLWGRYDAPMVTFTVGYYMGAGVGFSFNTGSVRHTLDLGFSSRYHADPGINSTASIENVAVIGTDRGRGYGARFAWMIDIAYGIAVTPSVTVLRGEVAYGQSYRLGNRRGLRFREEEEVTSILFGLEVSLGGRIPW